MDEPLIPFGLAHDWISILLKQASKIWRARRVELEKIFDTFGNAELLAKTYIEPDCQPTNPADFHEDEPIKTWTLRVPIRDWINEFLRTEFFERDGRNTLFVLSDAGMGKSSLLMMLKLSHMLRFWPDGLHFHLLKLGPSTLDVLDDLGDRRRTILLLDALDEDPAAWGRIEERVRELLQETQNFRQVIITCRTQFFPGGSTAPWEKPGKIEVLGYTCNLLYLSPFNDEQVNLYLNKIFPNKWTARAIKLITEKDNKDLVRARSVTESMQSLRMRPMLLSYIKDLIQFDIQTWQEYNIYQILVDHWLAREERKAEEREITKESLKEACLTVAMHLQATGQRMLTPEDLDNLAEKKSPVKDIGTINLKGRSLLNLTAEGSLRFAHYSIQEFMVAYNLVEMNRWPSQPLRVTDQILAFILSWISEDPKGRLPKVQWENLDLQGSKAARVDFSGLDLTGLRLPDYILRMCNLFRANLEGAVLEKANLEGSQLSKTRLVNANLKNANLKLCNLSHANLEGADLEGADLEGATMAAAHLKGSNLIGVSLKDVNLIDAKMWDVDLRGVTGIRGAKFMRAELNGAILSKLDLSGLDFHHASLTKADLRECDLANSNMRRADLRLADFRGANLSGARMVDAKIEGAKFDDGALQTARKY